MSLPASVFIIDESEPDNQSKIAESIAYGNKLRISHKSAVKRPIHSAPIAKSRRISSRLSTNRQPTYRPSARSVRCLRRYRFVLSDRLKCISRPPRRRVIDTWREYRRHMSPHMIERMRQMIQKPIIPYNSYSRSNYCRCMSHPYTYSNCCRCKRKTCKKQCLTASVPPLRRRRLTLECRATILFAKLILQKLNKSGNLILGDQTKKLSNLIQQDTRRYLGPIKLNRCGVKYKAKFMNEVSDKVALWCEEIVAESTDRMIMMDDDEDDEVTGKYDGFADEFLNMMGGRGAGDISAFGESEGQRLARLEAEKILGRPETPEERKRRLEMERRLGRPETPEELRARLEAEKKLGRPETEEEFKKRIAEQDLKKYGPETDAQKQARLAAENILGRPETDQERKRRLEIEKKLGRPETPEEMRARLAAEKRLGRPETEEELKARMAGGSGAGGAESEGQRKARLEAEKILGRPETPEERKRRLEVEKRLGRPETPEELRARLEAEKRLGRPETEEEFKQRIAEQDLKKYGKETDAQKQARLAAEKILGRPETDQERKRRLEIEKKLGRPETPEEMRARLEAEKILGRPETEEELKARMAGGGGAGGGAGGAESEGQRKARLEAENFLGRPETPEERKRRLEVEKRLGRPETPEELRARLEAEKRLGRPETEEEFKQRIAEQDLKKYGKETDAQKQARLAAEKILGRPETDQERKRRLEIEKKLGRPETPEEMRARLEAEKRLGRPETEEELKARMAGGGGAGGVAGGAESEGQRKARLEAEKFLGRPETPEERKRRLEVEKRLGRPETPEELRARLEAEKRLGRPETEEEFKQRIAEQDLKKYGKETDAQKQARLAAEKILGRPETDQERKRRLEIEKKLGRPETPEEMRARLEAEKRLGRPETEEELKARMAGGGGADGGAGGAESEGQRKARLEAEKFLGRPETPEERHRRLEVEKRLGRPETPEELRARLEAEKRLGRPETEEEFKQRIAEQDLKKYGKETDAQKQARLAAEKILGRPETDQERKRRLEIEKKLGRPETPEEMRARLEAEKRLGRPETEEELKARMVAGGGAGGAESEGQRKARLEAEKILGRPETPEERQRRLEVEKRLGRPETPEELRARLEAEKKLGRPETEEEFKKRIAEQDLKKYGPETDAQKEARLAAEKILGRPETDQERKRRLEIEKKLGRPETPEEMRARLEAEKRLGRPETEEELKARMAGGGGGASGGAGGPESEGQRLARLEAEKILGRPETPEERTRRLEIEKRLGRPETPEELRARLEAEKRLGRPETEEEFKKRIAEQDLKKYGTETDAQKRARQAAEKILGRPETDEERKRRLEVEKRLGRPETPEEMRSRLEAEKRLGRPETEEEFKARMAGIRPDPEKEAALQLLHKQLKAKGSETFYEQPNTKLTHAEASKWLEKEPFPVDNAVKESGDTQRLAKKFEKKLGQLMSASMQNAKTPAPMQDAMQDVIVESANKLGQYFVAKNYANLVSDGLIAAMQKRGNEILIDHKGKAETNFFAAQRLKLTDSLEAKQPCEEIAYPLKKRLDEVVKYGNLPRKAMHSMKDHNTAAADYLSEHVTKPHPKIAAYVALLEEMEAAGSNQMLIEENDLQTGSTNPGIKKSYKEAAEYLRQQTTFKDRINRPDNALQSKIEGRLKNLMENVTPHEYGEKDRDSIIKECAGLLTSYVKQQAARTEALNHLADVMAKEGDNVLVRHGPLLKTYKEGAEQLRTVNADQLKGQGGDPVAARKIQIKLNNIMRGKTPAQYSSLMDGVIADASQYLAVALFKPQSVGDLCACRMNVFVQCELWRDEILRSLSRPSCKCSRHDEDTINLDMEPCVSTRHACGGRVAEATASCPIKKVCPGCHGHGSVHSFMLHSVILDRDIAQYDTPTRLPREPCVNCDVPNSQYDSGVQIAGSEHEFHGESSTSQNICGKDSQTTELPVSSILSPLASDESMTHGLLNLPSASSITTDQMSDWHSMNISLMWNVQAWCEWLQAIVDYALNYSPDDVGQDFMVFQRKAVTEAMQWRQYNVFSRLLTLRLALRYRDKLIMSRGTNRTKVYAECQQEMLQIIEMVSRWTRWLTVIIQDTTDSIKQPSDDSNVSLNQLCWTHFKRHVEEIVEDWAKYKKQLKCFWDQKYNNVISELLPLWQSGPVWVVSACGAVPSSAVVAGNHNGETIYVARTTHMSEVVPAALIPSKQCCLVYADGTVYHYTKYQVICNARVVWQSWHAGRLAARAVRVSDGVHVGRVWYRGAHLIGAVRAPVHRCHIVLYGRAFTFNCYDLLVLANDDIDST